MPLHRAKVATKPRFASRLVDFSLTLLAIGGSVCLVLVVLGIAFNISIMMFRTGSMSPTITAGSIAFVKEIPARDMEVGDVVTVHRGEHELPVTHRVLEIQDIKDSGFVSFTMKGDGNDTADVEPYNVSTVKRVFFSAPGLAPLIQKFNSPLTLGGLTLGATALVVWTFWPRRSEEKFDETVAVEDTQAAKDQLLVLPVFAIALSSVAFPLQPINEPVQMVTGQYLRIASAPTAKMSNLSPGDSATWTLDVWAETPDLGQISIVLQSEFPSGHSNLPLTLSIVECQISLEVPMTRGCPEGPTLNRRDVPLQELQQSKNLSGLNLVEFESNTRHRVTITGKLPAENIGQIQGRSASIKLVANAANESVSAYPDGEPQEPIDHPRHPVELPSTGTGNYFWLCAAAALLLAVGTILAHRKKESADV